MRIKLAAACAALSIVIGFGGLALAASSTTTKATTGTASTTAATGDGALSDADHAVVPVWPKAATKLTSDQQPVATSFTLGQIEGIKPELISGVTANGYARKVTVEGQTIGQVLVTSVAKGNRSETISASGLTAQFDASQTSELFPEKSLTVEGSKAALISALQKLNTDAATDEKKKTATDATQENAVGGTSPSNDLASSYKTPTTTSTTTVEEDPVVSYQTTTEGCSIRVDLSQEKAFVQSKTQTFSDGTLSSETECSDSEISYPLKKSYLACPDVVSTDELKAWAQYTLYYADDAGETHTVSECTKDTDTPYTITETESACSVFLDFAAAQAIPQSALIYTNRNGATVQARACGTSTLSAAIAMTESTAACPLRHDYAANLSYELSMWSYVRDGVTYQAAPCADTGRSFAQTAVYTNTAGDYICTPIVNQTAGTVTLQSRKQITIDGVSQYVTECTPDTSTQAILSTTDGCMDPSTWTHDIEAGTSYGQERFYYLKGGTTPVYVTACQTSATTYSQDQTITGYQYHDDQLYAYPLSTVTITVSGSTYTIKSSEVLPGAAQFAYTLDGTIDRQNGAATYEGCNAYYTTTRYERWKRPDDTYFEKAIGDGTPVGPADVCSTTTETSDYLWDRGTTTYVYGQSCSDGGGEVTTCSNLTTGGSTATQYLLSRTVRTNPNTGETFTGSAVTTGSLPNSTSRCIALVPSWAGGSYSNEGWGGPAAPSGYTGPYFKSGPTQSSTQYGTYYSWDATCWRGTSYSWSGTSTMPGR